jgi:hypothetical protein
MKKHQVLTIGILVFSSLALITSGAGAALNPVERNVSVSALVPPRNADFQFDFTSDGQTSGPQNTTLDYQITYGASSSAGVSTNTTIVADFNDDLAPGNSHVLDYVIGSASDGFNGTQPVVNLTNRTITWTITNLPAGTTNQTITFQLRTNENYTGAQIVSFSTRASFSNQYITLTDQTLTQSYQFDQNLVTPTPTTSPTPTITPTPIVGTTVTPGPQATPTNAPTPTPTVTPSVTPSQVQILDVAFTGISDAGASIGVTANQPVSLTIRYGTSPIALTQTVQTTQPATYNKFDLKDLKPDTAYYFQILATGSDGHTRTSEIFTFTTARDSQPPVLTNNSVVITSGDKVIISGIPNGETIPFGFLTTKTNYLLTYAFSQQLSLKSFEVIVRDQNGNETRTVHLNEKESKIYHAQLKSNDTGLYEVFVKITDPKGNVVEQKIAILKFVHRIQVLEQGSNLPISDARIFISKLNPATNKFEPLDSGKNPQFTDTGGEIDTILSQGKYRAEISALLYAGKSIEFTLGKFDGQEFPTVYLQKDPFHVAAFLNNIQNIIVDSSNVVFVALNELIESTRFNSLISGITVGSFTLLSSLLFYFRTDMLWKSLLPFFIFNVLATVKKHHEAYLYGIVLDPDKNPVSRARIEVIDLKSNTVLTHALSNKSGRFVLKNTFKQQYIKFQITKDGFAEREIMTPTDTKKLIEINVALSGNKPTMISRGIKHTLGEFFELILLLSLIAELIFLFNYGIAKTMPFFLLSVANLLLWIFFQREKKL